MSRGQAGQTSAEYLGGLLVVALIVAAVATGDVGTWISDRVEQAVCAISGTSCEATEPTLQRAVGGPDRGPALTGGDIPILPFPGSVSVTCGVSEGSKTSCEVPEGPGVRVQGTGTVTVERSPTSLGADGCPQQTVSVGTTFTLEQVGEGKRGKATGKLGRYLGRQTNYAVTVAPDQAENIEQGRRVSSAAERVDARTVRVYVGDEDFVRNALAVGFGGAEASFSREVADGKLKSVDIDVSSPEGWNAYQDFVTTGRLPDGTGPGTSDPASATTRKASQSAKLEATFGNLTVGGLLSDAEGNYVATTHADGSVDHDLSIRYRDVGLALGVREDAEGNPAGDRTYALNLEGVRPDVFANFQELNFGDPRPPADGNVRWDLTGDDLMGMRTQALEQIAFELEQRGANPRPSAQEVAENLERNHGVIRYGPHDFEYWPEGAASVLANARDPEGVLEGLYRLANGDPNTLLAGPLSDFVLRTNAANGDANPSEDGRLPGAVHGPACGD